MDGVQGGRDACGVPGGLSSRTTSPRQSRPSCKPPASYYAIRHYRGGGLKEVQRRGSWGCVVECAMWMHQVFSSRRSLQLASCIYCAVCMSFKHIYIVSTVHAETMHERDFPSDVATEYCRFLVTWRSLALSPVSALGVRVAYPCNPERELDVSDEKPATRLKTILSH